MTTENKLNLLLTTKQNIKSAIEEKGQIVGDIPFKEYPERIEAIKVGVDVKDGLVFTNAEKTEATLYVSDGVIPEYMVNRIDENDRITTHLNLKVEGQVTSVGDFALRGVELNEHFFSVNNIQSLGDSPFNGSSFLNDDLIVKADWANKYKMFFYTTFKSISFDSNVTNIANNLFQRSTILDDLDYLQLPPGLLMIGDYAFRGLETTKTFEVVIPESVQEIGFSPFEDSKVRKLTAGPNIVRDAYGDPGKYRNFSNMSELLDAKVTSGGIYERTFYYCPKMHTCEIGSPGNHVTEIKNGCFDLCKALAKLIIYVANPASPPDGAPWGATNPELNIEYRQA